MRWHQLDGRDPMYNEPGVEKRCMAITLRDRDRDRVYNHPGTEKRCMPITLGVPLSSGSL
jgi:hypothetical protein